MTTAVQPPTYPARPVNGGDLNHARPKTGEWYCEPKYDGWRALVHVPSGAMFNRKGRRLSIEQEFQPAIAVARQRLNAIPRPQEFAWLDCEALERRLPVGKGTLLILDAPMLGGDYLARWHAIWNTFGFHSPYDPLPEHTALGVCHWTWEMFRTLQIWQHLQLLNRRFGCEVYEGCVAKKADSLYPLQLRSPDATFPFWLKHRFVN